MMERESSKTLPPPCAKIQDPAAFRHAPLDGLNTPATGPRHE